MNELLLAANPQELITAQHAMVRCVDAKIVQSIHDAKAAAGMRDQMLGAGLNSKQAKVIHKRATERVGYLVRVKAALEAGYVMMPDMPGEVVAVRTDATGPTRPWREYTADWSVPFVQANHRLPHGEGRYVSRNAVVYRHVETVTKKRSDGSTYTEKENRYRAVSLRDPDGLNKTFIRPKVIDRVSGAMMAGIFDEIVCVRSTDTRRKNKDPIVLGRIVTGKTVSAFLIAWFMDTSEL